MTQISTLKQIKELCRNIGPAVLTQANLVVADAIPQWVEQGKIAKALATEALQKAQIIELGEIVSGRVQGRTTKDQSTVADLTEVAVQDIQIAKAVCAGLKNEEQAHDHVSLNSG